MVLSHQVAWEPAAPFVLMIRVYMGAYLEIPLTGFDGQNQRSVSAWGTVAVVKVVFLIDLSSF